MSVSRRTTILASGAILLTVIALAAVMMNLHNRSETQAAADAAAADAVAAAQLDPFVDRLMRVRTAVIGSLTAARSSHESLLRTIGRARDVREAATEAESDSDGEAATVRSVARARPEPRPSGGLLIGDSVSLGAESCLAPLGYSVDSEVGRQFDVGLQSLRSHAGNGLPNTVVVHLGTNGPFAESGFDEVMTVTGTDRRVVWVTIALPAEDKYSFADSLNRMIRSKAQNYDNVRIADFAAQAAEHPEWMAPDGVHIGGSGCAGFAEVVDAAVTAP